MGSVGAVNILMDHPGTTARYGPNELVTIEAGNSNFVGNCDTAAEGGKPGRQTKGLKDWFQPWADLYVVPSGQVPTNNETLTDVGGSPNAVFGSTSGSFLYETLGLTFPTGKLPAGVYGIVVDECQNGVFDLGEDSYLEDVFWVDTDDDVPPLSPQAVGFLKLKETAAGAAGKLSAVQALLALREAYDAADKAAGLLAASVSGEAMVSLLLGYTLEVLQENSPYHQLQARAKELAKQTVTQVQARYARLADDPPDTSYQRYAVPATVRPVYVETNDPLDAAWTRYLAELDVMGGLVGAILDSAERYQGADVAGNGAWARRHAVELQALLGTYRDRLPAFTASSDALDQALRARYSRNGNAFVTTLRNASNVPPLVADPDAARVGTVRNSGVDIPKGQADAIEWEGATPKPEAEQLAEWLAIVDEAEAGIVAFGDSTNGFAAQAADAEAYLLRAVPTIVDDPAVSIEVVGPPAAGREVTFRLAGATTADVVRWDLDGDGATDDGLGAEVPWTIPGNAEVGVPLVVTAELARAAQASVAHQVVTVVAGGNRGPQRPAGPGPDLVGLRPRCHPRRRGHRPRRRRPLADRRLGRREPDTVDPSGARSVGRAFVAAHTYGTAGTHSVEACLRDGDGGRTCRRLDLVVAPATTSTTSPSTTTTASDPSSSTTTTAAGTTSTAPGAGGAGGPADPGTSGGDLARTGGDPRPALWLGALLVGVGGAALAARRRWLGARVPGR